MRWMGPLSSDNLYDSVQDKKLKTKCNSLINICTAVTVGAIDSEVAGRIERLRMAYLESICHKLTIGY